LCSSELYNWDWFSNRSGGFEKHLRNVTTPYISTSNGIEQAGTVVESTAAAKQAPVLHTTQDGNSQMEQQMPVCIYIF
jgi:hypothetical protein